MCACSGIIPRAAAAIFKKLQADEIIEKTVSVSYLEIYNTELNDLLLPTPPTEVAKSSGGPGKTTSKESGGGARLRVVEGAGNAGVYCHGLTSQKVETVADVLKALQDVRSQTIRQLLAMYGSFSERLLLIPGPGAPLCRRDQDEQGLQPQPLHLHDAR